MISGYLIGCLLFNELNKSGKINIRYFYYRRSIRIIPVYSLAIVFYFLVGASYKEELWANIIFVNNMLPAEQSAMAWCWSLAVEEQFYFLLPIIFIASYRFNVDIFKLLLGALVLSLIVRCYMLFSAPVLIEASTRSIMFDGLIFNDFFNVMYNNLTTRFGELSVGVISAYVYTYKKLEMEVYFKSTWGAVSQFLCCVVIFFMFFYGGFQFDNTSIFYLDNNYKNYYLVFNRLVFSASVAVAILGFVSSGHKVKKTKVKVFCFWSFYARLSYSIYVFHPFVIFGLCQLVYKSYSLEMAESGSFYCRYVIPLVAISFLLSTCLSVFIYVFLEKPFLNIREFGDRRREMLNGVCAN